jgi:N-acetylglutamate synthase-like GNAT family acetyltransferase
MSKPLPAGIVLRSATQTDDAAIRAIVRGEHLNPLNLHWRNFVVAEDAQRRIVGIGAVKRHGDGSRELASIAVLPEWRGRGVSTAVIDSLFAREGGTLYLTCRETMTGFYERFGFRRIGTDEMTPYFRRLVRLLGILLRALHAGSGPVVMKRDK